MIISLVATYYDANSRAFLRFGAGGGPGLMHRPIYPPGVRTTRAAVHTAHRLILDQLDLLGGRAEAHVLDLGCGVGGSLAYLLEQGVRRGTGVTISAHQVRSGQRTFAQRFGGRLELRHADFCDPAAVLAGDPVDLAFAIESLAHASSAEAFFGAARRHLRPRGRLVLCDDVLDRPEPPPRGSRAERALRDLRDGWGLPSLLPARDLRRLARRAGFEAAAWVDLTPHLRLDRPRDRALAVAVALLRPLAARRSPNHPRWRALLGGNALRSATKLGWVRYQAFAWHAP